MEDTVLAERDLSGTYRGEYVSGRLKAISRAGKDIQVFVLRIEGINTFHEQIFSLQNELITAYQSLKSGAEL